MKCRIVLADDHALIRHGIRKMIEESAAFEVVGEVGDGLELLDLLKDTPADLVVLDISMPNLRGIEAIKEVKKITPEVKILILTMHKSEQYLCSSVTAGANGYLLKEDSDTELLPAIEQVVKGDFYISPYLAKEFPDDVLKACQQRETLPSDTLTPRERQVLKLVAEGVTSKSIADLLNISKRTVEHHRANLMRKLNINKVADLIKYAIRKGYVTPPDE